MPLAMWFQLKSRRIQARPRAPIAARSASGSESAISSAFAIASGVPSIHQPQCSDSNACQGVAVVVSIGTLCASASTTTIPKFSECEGSRNASAEVKARVLSAQYRGPQGNLSLQPGSGDAPRATSLQ